MGSAVQFRSSASPVTGSSVGLVVLPSRQVVLGSRGPANSDTPRRPISSTPLVYQECCDKHWNPPRHHGSGFHSASTASLLVAGCVAHCGDQAPESGRQEVVL